MNRFARQRILPAVRRIKDLESLLHSRHEYVVLLETHIGQLKNLLDLGRNHQKKMLVHMDLIQGLKNDEFATQFVCQQLKPFGIISTRNQAIITAKKNGILAVQRLFLLDSVALETSCKLMEQSQPDYIEVLPGVVPHLITEVHKRLHIPILAGGLIRTADEVESALQAQAVAVTTSMKELWTIEPYGEVRSD